MIRKTIYLTFKAYDEMFPTNAIIVRTELSAKQVQDLVDMGVTISPYISDELVEEYTKILKTCYQITLPTIPDKHIPFKLGLGDGVIVLSPRNFSEMERKTSRNPNLYYSPEEVNRMGWVFGFWNVSHIAIDPKTTPMDAIQV